MKPKTEFIIVTTGTNTIASGMVFQMAMEANLARRRMVMEVLSKYLSSTAIPLEEIAREIVDRL